MLMAINGLLNCLLAHIGYGCNPNIFVVPVTAWINIHISITKLLSAHREKTFHLHKYETNCVWGELKENQ
jgi:hypothetical protein